SSELPSELNPDLSTQISNRPFDFGPITHHHLQHSKHLHLSVVWFLKNFRLPSTSFFNFLQRLR
ncbi:MAG: hypothetical protein NTV11_17575, partial [Rhodocyclales bacterium]|nr:hypothetical protein [Rhodocyclales bacterium]